MNKIGSFPRWRSLDARAWMAATWSVPFVTQVLLMIVIVCSWILGKVFVGADGFLLFALGTAVALIASAAVVAALSRSASPRALGLALSIAGSYVVVLVGGLIYGLWIIRW